MHHLDFHNQKDEVAEWLRRLTANQLGYTRVSSNLILVVQFNFLVFWIIKMRLSFYLIKPGVSILYLL